MTTKLVRTRKPLWNGSNRYGASFIKTVLGAVPVLSIIHRVYNRERGSWLTGSIHGPTPEYEGNCYVNYITWLTSFWLLNCDPLFLLQQWTTVISYYVATRPWSIVWLYMQRFKCFKIGVVKSKCSFQIC